MTEIAKIATVAGLDVFGFFVLVGAGELMRTYGSFKLALLLGFVSLSLAGCGSSFELSDLGDFQIPEFVPTGEFATTASPATIDQVTAELPIDDSASHAIRHDDPRSVVIGFLESIKRADDHALRSLLTRKSIDVCRENSIEFTIPQAHPLAACQVQYAKFVPDDDQAAHVRCLWSNTGGEGSTTEAIMVLRSERLGQLDNAFDDRSVWRIAGMVVHQNGIADVFNFESAMELAAISGSFPPR